MKTNTKKQSVFLLRFAAAAFWVIVWQILSLSVNLPLLLPSPLSVAVRIGELCLFGDFWFTVATTFSHVLLGFLLGVIAGCGLAILCWRFPLIQILVDPALGIMKATPVASFIILALVWVRSSMLSVLICFLMVLPIIYHNILEGISCTSRELLEMATVFRLSPWKKFYAIYLPSVQPFFLSAVTSAMGFAWKSGIAAEVLGRPVQTIGTQIYNAKIYLETVDLFSWTLVVILLSICIESIMVRLVGKFGKTKV